MKSAKRLDHKTITSMQLLQ